MNEIETRLATLEQHLATLLAENTTLRQRLEQLEAPATGAVPPGEPDGGGAVVAEHRPVSRRGMIAAVAGAAGGMLLAQATPAAAANGGSVVLGAANTATLLTDVTCTVSALSGTTSGVGSTGVFGTSTATTGSNYGVQGRVASSAGRGVYGAATATTGTTYGLYGTATSTAGLGVYGLNSGTTGATGGYAVYADGRFKAVGRSYLGTPATAPTDADLGNGSVSLYLDEVANQVKARVKSSAGVLSTATLSGNVVLGGANTAVGTTAVTTTGSIGLQGVSSNATGYGVSGTATAASGANYGVYGQSASTAGYGVVGNAYAASGTTYGVYGLATSAAGFALYGSGRLKVTGRSYLGTPTTAPADTDLNNGSVSLYLDEVAGTLKVRVKFSNGTTLRTATIALA